MSINRSPHAQTDTRTDTDTRKYKTEVTLSREHNEKQKMIPKNILTNAVSHNIIIINCAIWSKETVYCNYNVSKMQIGQ